MSKNFKVEYKTTATQPHETATAVEVAAEDWEEARDKVEAHLKSAGMEPTMMRIEELVGYWTDAEGETQPLPADVRPMQVEEFAPLEVEPPVLTDEDITMIEGVQPEHVYEDARDVVQEEQR